MTPDELKNRIRAGQKTEKIDIPGYGPVTIRELSADAIVRFADGLPSEDENDPDIDGKESLERFVGLIIDATVTPEGEPEFEDTEEYRSILTRLTQDQLETWSEAILNLSGMKEEEETKKKDSAQPGNLRSA